MTTQFQFIIIIIIIIIIIPSSCLSACISAFSHWTGFRDV